MSLQPINVCCKEEHEELTRLFQLEAEASKTSNPVEVLATKHVNSYAIDFSRDIAVFKDYREASYFSATWVSGLSHGSFSLAKRVQHIAIEEVVTKMPMVTTAGSVSKKSLTKLGGFRNLLRYLYWFPAIKSITIIRLCYPKKMTKVLGQKRHKAPWEAMSRKDANIFLKCMRDYVSNLPKQPTFKVLNFPA